MRPRIGLNTSVIMPDGAPATKLRSQCNLTYVDAIVAAGGLPLLIPPYADPQLIDEILGELDGFCFIGGPDYHPEAYGGHRPRPSDELLHPRRHQFDLLLAERVLQQTQMPVLGICGGHQLLGITGGGALVQDIETEWHPVADPLLPHALSTRSAGAGEPSGFQHEVRIEAGCRLARIIGATTVQTNSYHHQALRPDRLGDQLRACAWSEDGIIEAVEGLEDDRFLLGVQWHPELHPGERAHEALFAALVDASHDRRRAAVDLPLGQVAD